ncbi:type VI secretion system baseplate subunit TssG [Pseudoduganella aquatica]|uniref:type VI secretion system baseplate subunit TssG n=1 Tax=Pseudoduganella aquatica TaxID=2660641 RepID=UPI001E4611F1|nr:type VI secretion system baseplate subunit TssG [Pseudoduganella aquatica]
MRTPQRQPAAGLTGLIGALLAAPQRFDFFQAVRLLEQWLDAASPSSESQPGMPSLRYRNRLSLAFPPCEITRIDEADGHLDVTPAFMGLLGSSGTLPHHYTERIAAHEQREDDDGPRAFLDMLSHRALAMFCTAWAMHRPECMQDAGGGDGYLAKLLQLSGAQPPPDCVIGRESFARYAMQIRSRTVSHDVMTGMLTEYFGVPAKVEPLVGVWEALPAPQQAQLGRSHCCLRKGVLLGERIHRCDTRARIRIGPLSKADFERFLLHGSGAAALQGMLAMFCTVGIAFEIRLLLRAADARGFSLHPSEQEGGARLGVNAFLLGAPSAHDREDASYLLTP